MNPYPPKVWMAMVALQAAIADVGGELHYLGVTVPQAGYRGSTSYATQVGTFSVRELAPSKEWSASEVIR